jgi:ribosome-associated protein
VLARLLQDTREKTVNRRGEDEEIDERPSKSERKRVAHAAQDLGETLIGLRDSDLEALNLPERLIDAIRDARRIPGRGGGARQRQYIGKLMRDIDLEPIRAALVARSEQSSLEAERFKRLEAWRERLLAEGAPALEDLEKWRPGLDRAEWLRRISAAKVERDRSGSGTASRELFRALRTLFGP